MQGHDPRVAANKLIAIAERDGFQVFNVSIQKLLYFAHASHLAVERRPLIRGVFEAWEFGPVCRPVYDCLKGYGRDPIRSPITRTDPLTGEVLDLPILSDPAAIHHLEATMRTLGRAHPNQLITLSHVPGGAWSIIWNKGRTGPTMGNRIDDKLTLETFGRYKIALVTPGADEELLDEATPFTGD